MGLIFGLVIVRNLKAVPISGHGERQRGSSLPNRSDLLHGLLLLLFFIHLFLLFLLLVLLFSSVFIVEGVIKAMMLVCQSA